MEFPVTPAMEKWARSHGFACDLEAQTALFLDHHRAKGSLFADWQAAWRNWIRHVDVFAAQRAGPALSSPARPFSLLDDGALDDLTS